MWDRATHPLEIARAVLRPETIREIRSGGFTNAAYLILDRWALNSPDDLRRLERQGPAALILKLRGQQRTEAKVLNSESARLAGLQGMTDWEILQSAGVEMGLWVRA